MQQTFTVTFMIAILATMTIVSAVDVLPEAEARQKASGTYTLKFGSATKGIVCGDRLCSEIKTDSTPSASTTTSDTDQKSADMKTHDQDKPDNQRYQSMIDKSGDVDQAYAAALDEVIHKFELDKISAEQAISELRATHEGFTSLHITSDLIEAVGTQIKYVSEKSLTDTLEQIHELIEMTELESVDVQMPEKILPPNTVDMPVGAGIPGCETNNACYTPTHLTVDVGTTVTWINSDGLIPHTVTAGLPNSDHIGTNYLGGNGFDSDFMSGGATFEHTFDVPGEYDYYCQLHLWMTGSITVE